MRGRSKGTTDGGARSTAKPKKSDPSKAQKKGKGTKKRPAASDLSGWDDLAVEVGALLHALKDGLPPKERNLDGLVARSPIGRSSISAAWSEEHPEFSLETLAKTLAYARTELSGDTIPAPAKLEVLEAYKRTFSALLTFLAGSESKMREYAFAGYMNVELEDQVAFSQAQQGTYLILRWDLANSISLSTLHIHPRAPDSVVCHFKTRSVRPATSANSVNQSKEAVVEIADGYIYIKGETVYGIGRTTDGSLRYSILKKTTDQSGDLAGIRLLHGAQPMAQRVYAKLLKPGDPTDGIGELGNYLFKMNLNSPDFAVVERLAPWIRDKLDLLTQPDARFQAEALLTMFTD